MSDESLSSGDEGTSSYKNALALFTWLVLRNLPLLSQEEINHWINEPEGIRRVLARFQVPLSAPHASEILQTAGQPGLSEGCWSNFSTVIVGVEKDYITALLKAGHHLDDEAISVANKIEYSLERKEVDLVHVQLDNIGVTDEGLLLEEILSRALERGFLPCPPEAALAFRLLNPPQAVGERITFAMKPVPGINNEPTILRLVRRSDGRTALQGKGRKLHKFKYSSTARFLFMKSMRSVT